MKIRPAEHKDIATIAAIGKLAFIEAFMNDANASEVLPYLDETYELKALGKRLDSEGICFLVIEDERQVKGFVELVSSNPPQSPDHKSLKLERLYIYPNSIGQGLGKALIEATLHLAKEDGYTKLWLQVLRTNSHAIAFYERWGMTEFHRSPAKFKADNEQDIWMSTDI